MCVQWSMACTAVLYLLSIKFSPCGGGKRRISHLELFQNPINFPSFHGLFKGTCPSQTGRLLWSSTTPLCPSPQLSGTKAGKGVWRLVEKGCHLLECEIKAPGEANRLMPLSLLSSISHFLCSLINNQLTTYGNITLVKVQNSSNSELQLITVIIYALRSSRIQNLSSLDRHCLKLHNSWQYNSICHTRGEPLKNGIYV